MAHARARASAHESGQSSRLTSMWGTYVVRAKSLGNTLPEDHWTCVCMAAARAMWLPQLVLLSQTLLAGCTVKGGACDQAAGCLD
jgi:hypothetical protein